MPTEERHEEIESLNAVIRQLNESVRREKDNARREKNEFEKLKDEDIKLKMEVSLAGGRVRTAERMAERQIAVLRQEKTQAQAQNQNLEYRLGELQQEHSKTIGILEELKMRNKRLGQQVNPSNFNNPKFAMKQKDEEIRHLQNQLGQLRDEANQQSEMQAGRITELEEKVEGNASEIAIIETQREEFKKRCTSLNRELETLNTWHNEIVGFLGSTTSMLRRELDNMRRSFRELERENGQTRRQVVARDVVIGLFQSNHVGVFDNPAQRLPSYPLRLTQTSGIVPNSQDADEEAEA